MYKQLLPFFGRVVQFSWSHGECSLISCSSLLSCLGLKSQYRPSNQQQGRNIGCCSTTKGSIFASAFCPDVWTSVLHVFMWIYISVPPIVPHPSCCFLLTPLLPPPLPELLSSSRQIQGEVVHHRWGWGGVSTVQPVCSRGSWVSVL